METALTAPPNDALRANSDVFTIDNELILPVATKETRVELPIMDCHLEDYNGKSEITPPSEPENDEESSTPSSQDKDSTHGCDVILGPLEGDVPGAQQDGVGNLGLPNTHAKETAPKAHKVGVTESTFSMYNSAIGAATLTMPFAVALSGWLLGGATIIAMGALSVITSRMLVRVAVAERVTSYDAAVERVLGSFWLHAYQACIILSTIGTLIALLILCGDFLQSLLAMSSVVDTSSNTARTLSIIGIATLAVLPLALLRSITALRATSYLSLPIVGWITLVLLIKACTGPAKDIKAVDTTLLDYARVFVITALAFSSQTSVLPVYRELSDANETKAAKYIGYNSILVTLTYFAIGVCGYCVFGGSTKGNVLRGFSTGSVDGLVISAILCFFVKAIISYPLLHFPCRVTVHYLLYGDTAATTTQHFLETFASWLISVAVACLVRDVAIVFSFVGAVARCSIFFLFPAALLLRCGKAGSLSRNERALCYLVIALGALSMTFGLASAVRNAIGSR